MSPQRTTILVVDDDEHTRSLLVDALADRAELLITAVGDGKAALAYVDMACPHLILLDVKLADLDGLTVYRRLRERADLARVPVLFLTGLSADHLDEQTAALPGPFQVLAKPFDLDVLDATVDALLRDA